MDNTQVRIQFEDAIEQTAKYLHNAQDWWDDYFTMEGNPTTVIDNLLDSLLSIHNSALTECESNADIAQDDIRILDEQIAKQDRTIAEQKETIAIMREYVRHNHGCSAPYGYPCRCGLDREKVAWEGDSPSEGM